MLILILIVLLFNTAMLGYLIYTKPKAVVFHKAPDKSELKPYVKGKKRPIRVNDDESAYLKETDN